MIFVTIGLTKPFDRLLDALEDIDADEELVVQCGDWNGRLPARARRVAYLSFDELNAHVRAATAVVCHAGVGSILVAAAAGKRPIVVPRRASFGEAPDDHQVALARRLHDLGVVRLVDDPRALGSELAGRADLDRVGSKSDGRLAAELAAYIADHVAA